MSKYVVIGGFLGAGKTTSMLAFSEYLRGKGVQPAILVDDLGARNLVDGKFTAAHPVVSDEITGGCICYQTENLVDKLRRFRDRDKADIIFSDIPGCGIGALDHVYHKLNQDYPGEFDLCPFVAVADPERLRVIMPEHADLHLPKEMEYLFDAQLREAEVILLNKCDLLSPEQIASCQDFLERTYPQAKVFVMSAKTGQGVQEAVEYLMAHTSALPVVDIGYGGEAFVAAEKSLSWYNRQFSAAAPDGETFDADAFVECLMEAVRNALQKNSRNVPHLKVFGTAPQGQVKASLIGVDYDLEFAQRLSGQTEKLSVIVNARAACESALLDGIMEGALMKAAEAFRLKIHVFFTECFGMMDEGRM